jgi:peptidoglycan/LPS O-acetylase OafA/YrhL
MYIFLHSGFGLIDARLIYYFVPFILGILCAVHDRVFILMKAKVTLILSLLALFITTYSQDVVNIHWVDVAVYGLRVWAIIPLLLVISDALSTKTPERIISEFSNASFCMYLYHRVIYKALLVVYTPPTNNLIVLYLGLVGLPLVYLLSSVVQHSYNTLLEKTTFYARTQKR